MGGKRCGEILGSARYNAFLVHRRKGFVAPASCCCISSPKPLIPTHIRSETLCSLSLIQHVIFFSPSVPPPSPSPHPFHPDPSIIFHIQEGEGVGGSEVSLEGGWMRGYEDGEDPKGHPEEAAFFGSILGWFGGTRLEADDAFGEGMDSSESRSAFSSPLLLPSSHV